MKKKRPAVSVKLPTLEFYHLHGALKGLARRPCRRSNCGTVCLCDSCAARRVLPLIEAQKPTGFKQS